MAVKPVSLPTRSLPNLQASAAGGRAFRAYRMTPSRLFPRTEPKQTTEPEQTEPEYLYEYGKGYNQPRRYGPADITESGFYGGMNKNDMIATVERGYYEGLTPEESIAKYRAEFRIPEEERATELKRLHGAPAGEGADFSEGVPEGYSDLSGFGLLNSLNEAGLASQKGDLKGTISHGFSAALKGIALPAQPLAMIVGQAYKGLKGAFAGSGGGAPSMGPLDSGIPGLGSHGALAEAQLSDLADIDVNPDTGFGVGTGGGSGGNVGGGEAPDSGASPY